MPRVADLFNDLSQCFAQYKAKFIQPYIPTDPTTTPAQYSVDVKAYCLLCHAALEHYFEEIASFVIKQAVSEWITNRRATETLVMMFCAYGLKCKISAEDKLEAEISVLARIDQMTYQAKVEFTHVVDTNHGTSPKYLRKLLLPAGIDYDPSPNVVNSLLKLCYERGEYAHKAIINRSIPPEDAEKYAKDCLAFADDTHRQVIAKGWTQ